MSHFLRIYSNWCEISLPSLTQLAIPLDSSVAIVPRHSVPLDNPGVNQVFRPADTLPLLSSTKYIQYWLSRPVDTTWNTRGPTWLGQSWQTLLVGLNFESIFKQPVTFCFHSTCRDYSNRCCCVNIQERWRRVVVCCYLCSVLLCSVFNKEAVGYSGAPTSERK